jgi:hypothetical protein
MGVVALTATEARLSGRLFLNRVLAKEMSDWP